jgi:hypothetical protein
LGAVELCPPVNKEFSGLRRREEEELGGREREEEGWVGY